MNSIKEFDYCISNPPYQLEGGGGGSNALNIYPNFMIFGKRIAKNSIMIHPARAFFGAGRFNADIVQEINDSKSFKCLEYIENASGLFPTAMIKGGLMISSYTENTVNPPMIEELIPKHLLSIQKKVINKEGFNSILNIMGSYNDNKFSDMAYEKYKEEMDTMKHTHTFVSNVFTSVSSIFENKEQNDNDYVSVLGVVKNKRTTKWINKKYVVLNSEYKDKWKVFIPGSMGSGIRGEKISDTFIGKPNMIATQTFIPFGLFDAEHEAMNFEKYLKSKFARALLSILKVTPSNGRKTWVNIPQVDFTEESEIDWNKDIDEQLYEMYDLTDEEKEWINKSILSMN